MKTVIEMAREAGFVEDMPIIRLERFAALVREDEREKQQEPVAVGAYEVVNEDGNEWELVYPEAIHKYKMIPEHRITQTFYTTPPTAAIAARQIRDAAVKVCKNFAERDMHPAECAGAIERLPVPEVKWRDLTDEEIKEAAWGYVEDSKNLDEHRMLFARAVIAKFKEKQL